MFRNRLTPFAMVLASGSLMAAGQPRLAQAQLNTLKAQQSARTSLALQRLTGARAALGLTADNAFSARRSSTDAFGILHVHVHQTYRGVPVWGGDAILHLDAENTSLPTTDKLVRGLDLAVTPALDASEALAIATRDMNPKGAFAYAPTSELVVVPRIRRTLRAGLSAAQANASDVVSTVTGADLTWHLRLDVQSQGDSRSVDYLISAINGAILKKWSSRETAGTVATGTGNSQYNGTVSITTNQLSPTSFTMQDSNRGGTTVTDMANGTSGSGTLYTDTDNTWGDGNNYYDGATAGGTSGVTGQTAAVDAKYGFDATWDYYKNVHSRNGIDDTGKATTLRMHYATAYDNAFWNDGCFCMTFGDGSATSPAGSGFHNLTAIDVIGHELSHGVIANSVSGGLNYFDESGGLNESDSDINGTFVTYYAYNGGTGSVVPNTIPADGTTTSGYVHNYMPWTIGFQISDPPLRYMYKPSLDGVSPDAWSFDIGQLDPHLASGPMNRAMYFLAQGATTTGNTSSTYLPTGMTGLGNDKASAIWYYVMTNGLTSASTYHDARLAAIAAAKVLYGGTETAPSTELAAVQNAFHGINVGPVAGQVDDTTAPTGVTASETGTSGSITFGATATDDVGVARIDFAIDGTVMAGMNTAGSTLFDSHMIPNGNHTLVATAYDAYRNSTDSAPVSFTTLNSFAQFLTDPGFEQGGVNWFFAGSAGVSVNPSFAHGGNNYAIVSGSGTNYAYQPLTLPAGLPNLALTAWTRISTTSTATTATDNLYVQVYDAGGNNVLATLGSVSNRNSTGAAASDSHWVQVGPYDLKAFAGQSVLLVFITDSAEGKTSFRLDDLSLNTQYANPDQNGDGKVDGVDLGLFAAGFNPSNPLSDLNNDGAVDGLDTTILLNAFGK